MTILAIDIGGTKVRAGLVDENSTSLVRTIATAPGPGETSIMPSILRLVGEYSGYSSIAVASAGVISEGRVVSATDLIPHWAGTDIAGELAVTGVPVSVLGDVHAHGLGEAVYGAARGHHSSLTVGVGTGIGGAYVSHDGPMVGAHGVAGHIGHVSHADARDLTCSCGRTGHIEPLSSGTGMVEAYERLTGELVSGRELDQRAENGDQSAISVLSGGGFALGDVLGSLANTLDPGIIVISGSVSRSAAFWWPSLIAGYRSSAMDPVSATPLVRGELGDDAPLLGAASYAKVFHA
ncbi:ROK family protein [Flaviflexus equikiangi]|uniref:ROK family protein n=1 Tax=Flaviflexus equikiangi TaxID=2758573 RepID=UPI0015F6D30B|nr:ROK family protein [Flaviflexus equikiangi]